MPNFKVLVTDQIHSKAVTLLKENKAEILYKPEMKPDELGELTGDVDAIILRGPFRIDKGTMEQAPRLKVIGRTGIGLDNVDISTASNLGIFVVYTPEGPVEAVAEYIAMVLLGISHRVIKADRATRRGDWNFRNRELGREVRGRTLGNVGFGRIGRRLSEICGLGLKMKIIYSDVVQASLEEEKRLGATRVPLHELLSTSDFVSITVPLMESTFHLIGKKELELMKSHALFVNTSRGPVVDESALIDVLKNRKIAGAAIDVFESEPVSLGNELLKLDNVILSPHCAGITLESDEKISMVAADVIRILNGRKPEFPANAPKKPRQSVS